jgi:hypothetical protein
MSLVFKLCSWYNTEDVVLRNVTNKKENYS